MGEPDRRCRVGEPACRGLRLMRHAQLSDLASRVPMRRTVEDHYPIVRHVERFAAATPHSSRSNGQAKPNSQATLRVCSTSLAKLFLGFSTLRSIPCVGTAASG